MRPAVTELQNFRQNHDVSALILILSYDREALVKFGLNVYPDVFLEIYFGKTVTSSTTRYTKSKDVLITVSNSPIK